MPTYQNFRRSHVQYMGVGVETNNNARRTIYGLLKTGQQSRVESQIGTFGGNETLWRPQNRNRYH